MAKDTYPLNGMIITGLPGTGKSTIREHIAELARSDGLTPILLKDRDFVQRLLLAAERTDITLASVTAVGPEGEWREYSLPDDGEAQLKHGTLYMHAGDITHFSLKTPYAFQRGRELMLRHAAQTAELTPRGLFIIIEYCIGPNKLTDNGYLVQDSDSLYKDMQEITLHGKPLAEQFAVVELHADDATRSERNDARLDKLHKDIWEQFYMSEGGSMHPSLQERLIFWRLNTDTSISTVMKKTREIYQHAKIAVKPGMRQMPPISPDRQ